MTTKTTTSFLTLPSELRIAIYKHTFRDDDVLDIWKDLTSDHRRISTVISLLQSCRQVRAELLPTIIHDLKLCIRITSRCTAYEEIIIKDLGDGFTPYESSSPEPPHKTYEEPIITWPSNINEQHKSRLIRCFNCITFSVVFGSRILLEVTIRFRGLESKVNVRLDTDPDRFCGPLPSFNRGLIPSRPWRIHSSKMEIRELNDLTVNKLQANMADKVKTLTATCCTREFVESVIGDLEGVKYRSLKQDKGTIRWYISTSGPGLNEEERSLMTEELRNLDMAKPVMWQRRTDQEKNKMAQITKDKKGRRGLEGDETVGSNGPKIRTDDDVKKKMCIKSLCLW